MVTNEFPIEAYLKRVGLKALPPPTLEGLKTLVRAQTYSIAFENLDVLAGRSIRLDRDVIASKILTQGRGGYCYELNGLLDAALEAAGFRYERRLARVTYRRPSPGPKSHLTFQVGIDGQDWLVDVGFGGPGLVEPALMEAGREFLQNDARFRLIDEDGELHLQRRIAGEWAGLYRVSFDRILPIDIEVVNHFVSTWDRSPFRSIFMCVFPRREGLYTVDGTDLVLFDHELSPIKRTPIEGAPGLKAMMRSTFGLDVDDETALKAWNKVSHGGIVKAEKP